MDSLAMVYMGGPSIVAKGETAAIPFFGSTYLTLTNNLKASLTTTKALALDLSLILCYGLRRTNFAFYGARFRAILYIHHPLYKFKGPVPPCLELTYLFGQAGLVQVSVSVVGIWVYVLV